MDGPVMFTFLWQGRVLAGSAKDNIQLYKQFWRFSPLKFLSAFIFNW